MRLGDGFWEVHLSKDRASGADCWLTDVVFALQFSEQACVYILEFHLNPLSRAELQTCHLEHVLLLECFLTLMENPH